MSWSRAIDAADVGEGQKKVATVGQREVLIINRAGKIHAVESTCPHMGARLDRGKVTEDGLLVCPWHGSSFRLDSGRIASWTPRPPLVGWFLGLLGKKKALRVYDTKVEDGSIWVDV
jgi:nitrite reductase/ring-hydroxylating ferredoxin subunit